MRRTTDRKELDGGSSCVVSEWSFFGSDFDNSTPTDREGATSVIIAVGLLVDCKVEAAFSSGEAGLEGILEREEIGERKVTTGSVGMSKPEGVNGWKSSSGSEKTERQSPQAWKIGCNAAKKKSQNQIK